jgi:dTMP kinase
MSTTERRGRFITFEGTDGSGKTTQLKILAGRLRAAGNKVVETVEPGGTRIGRQVRRILLDPANRELCPAAEMLLYFAARAQNFEQIILPAWERGAIVLSDRFTDSTLAYQGGGRGIDRGTVMTLHDIACHGLQPDLTVFIDIDLETSRWRASERNKSGRHRDRIDEEAAEFHERVRSAYLQLAAEHPRRIVRIEGAGSRSEIADRIWKVVSP